MFRSLLRRDDDPQISTNSQTVGEQELSVVDCKQAFAGETPAVREHDTEVFIARCIRDGRLVPAQAEFARLLLQTPGAITFGERSVSVAEIFERLIERQVPHRLFSELGREGVQDYSEHLLLPEEADFYRKHFPEISLDDIAQRKRAHPSI